VQAEFMVVVVALFRQRDERICDAHTDVNGAGAHYIPIRCSLYYGPGVLDSLDDEARVDTLLSEDPALEPGHIAGVHNIYLLRKTGRTDDESQTSWSLVIVSMLMKQIWFIDPLGAQDVPQFDALHALLRRKMGVEYGLVQWPSIACPTNLCNPIANSFDSAISVLLAMYCVSHDTPNAIREDDIASFCDTVAYWTLTGRLPV
jgi:hypothetical protein